MDRLITLAAVSLAAIRLAKRRQAEHEEEVQQLMEQFVTMAARLHMRGMRDTSNMSAAEVLACRALEASDDGADGEAFWSTLREELRAYIDSQRSGTVATSTIGRSRDAKAVRR
jgi:hypothetical protein